MDGDEVSVAIGKLHHRHFPYYNYGTDLSDETLRAAVDDSLDYIDSIMKDEIEIRAYFDGDQISGSSASGSTVILSESKRTNYKDFVWSGPKTADA